MFFRNIVIRVLFSILLFASSVDDNEPSIAEYRFVPSFAANTNIVSDVFQGLGETRKFIELQTTITSSSVEISPWNFDISKPVELYNLTFEAKNLTAERGNPRFYAETLNDDWRTTVSKIQSFVIGSSDYVCNISESEKAFILLTYLYATCKYYGAIRLRPISKIRSKYALKPRRATSPKSKISLSEDHLPNVPSEKSCAIEADIICDSQVLTTSTNDTACRHHVDSDDETSANTGNINSCTSSTEELCAIFQLPILYRYNKDLYFIPIHAQLKCSPSPDGCSADADEREDDFLAEWILGSYGYTYGFGEPPVEESDDGMRDSQGNPCIPLPDFCDYCSSSDDFELPQNMICDVHEDFSLHLSDLDTSSDQSECSRHNISVPESDSEYDFGLGFPMNLDNYQHIHAVGYTCPGVPQRIYIENEDEVSHEVDVTLEQRVKNHTVAAAIFTGAFVLPCFIAAKLLK